MLDRSSGSVMTALIRQLPPGWEERTGRQRLPNGQSGIAAAPRPTLHPLRHKRTCQEAQLEIPGGCQQNVHKPAGCHQDRDRQEPQTHDRPPPHSSHVPGRNGGDQGGASGSSRGRCQCGSRQTMGTPVNPLITLALSRVRPKGRHGRRFRAAWPPAARPGATPGRGGSRCPHHARLH